MRELRLRDSCRLSSSVSMMDLYFMELKTSETVKIKGYDVAPTIRENAGHFPYKGTSLIVDVANSPYYVIHLDVHRVVPCPQ